MTALSTREFCFDVLIFFISTFTLLGESKKPDPRLTFHVEAQPLHQQALTHDWHRFNGPHDNAVSGESHLQLDWAGAPPSLLWEVTKGDGYASPAISKGIVVMFHRLQGQEVIEGRDAETGNSIWQHAYPVEYRDRYGYLDGPRASPVIVGDFVYAHGVTAWLTCLELKSGRVHWKRNLGKEFQIPQNFFGKGSNPLPFGETLILNIGGSKQRSVVGLDLKTGDTNWVTEDEWGASYSSPCKAIIHDREVCLVFAGGESRPSTGGLLVIDPKNGKKLSRFAWRSKSFESVNAVPPIPLGKNRVYLSECYEKGSAIIQFDEALKPSVSWQDPNLNIHWMTPVVYQSYLFGISGRHQRGAQVFCLDFNAGVVKWREPITWSQVLNKRELSLQLFRGSLLKVGVTDNKFVGLSELGSLISVELTPKGWHIISTAQLFFSPSTWTLPALSKGLLYVMQNEKDRVSGTDARLLCYDLRKK
ncbi:MAG: PQQ-binding-like beta-propeller repeat protein [Opitutales bacterium]|nr:PQQ-binding-like beta-propeller repeat protein [Opitutales bacterium]